MTSDKRMIPLSAVVSTRFTTCRFFSFVDFELIHLQLLVTVPNVSIDVRIKFHGWVLINKNCEH